VIELDRRHGGAGGLEAAGQDAEARTDLGSVGRRGGGGQDGVEDVDVGEEVLRQAVARSQAGLAEGAADGIGTSGGGRAGAVGGTGAVTPDGGRSSPGERQ
jgi:hypothetical protein